MNSHGTTYVNREAASLSGEEIEFSFGRNWLTYAAGLEERHIMAAERSFVELTGLASLSGHTFLDAGCGSGLSSLVALRLHADRVCSVDIDPSSVACAEQLRCRFAIDSRRWAIHTCSVLDRDLSVTTGLASMVCCWGVAHHTGSMWNAIDNVSRCVADGGWLLVAIYNRTDRSGTWLTIKRFYNRAPAPVKTLLRLGFHLRTFAGLAFRGQHPRRFLEEYVRHRGMSYFRDVEDWLGGLPYEYASVDEVTLFLALRGFEPVRIKPAVSHGCNEFVFRRITTQGPVAG